MRTIPCGNNKAGVTDTFEHFTTTGALILNVLPLVLGLMVFLPTARVFAQPCVTCPADAQVAAVPSLSFDGFVTRLGTPVSSAGGEIGGCETITLKANVAYNTSVTASGGIGAGFTAGSGHYILVRRGAVIVSELLSDNTPNDMATTLVAPVGAINSCAPPAGTAMAYAKDLKDFTYTLNAADIASGFLQFEFEYTNATSLNPNQNNQCIDKVSASVQFHIFIAPPPSCAITPPAKLSPGSCENITVTVTGQGPLTITLTGPGTSVSSNLYSAGSVTFTNIACAPASGITNNYLATVADFAGCTTNCSTSVAGAAIPRFTIVGIAGSALIMSGSGGASNGTYTVSTTTNLNTPSPVWIPVATNHFDSIGQFSFTNSIDLNESKRFFRIALP